MGSYASRGGGDAMAGRGRNAKTGDFFTPDDFSNSAPALDKDLVQRANSAGMFVDYGDAGVRQYNRQVDEISKMDLTSDEKKNAYSELHKLTTAQLEAESKAVSPYSMGVGPARFNSKQMNNAQNKAANARADVDKFMQGLRTEQRKKAARKEQQLLTNAMQKALNDGALSFTVNGTTWSRKSKRSKSFTAN